jgi:hypothetical protein
MTDTALLFEQAAPASLDLVLGGDVEAVPLGPNDLLFERTGNPSTHLVFGDDPSLVATAAEITITGAFPALTAVVKMYPVAEIAITGAFPQPVLLVNVTANVKLIITGAFPPLQAVVEVSYSSNTSRPDVAQLTDTAQIGTAVEWGVAQPQQHALPQNSGAQTAFTEAQLINAGMQVGFDDTRRQSSQAEAGFADAAQLPAAQTRETMQEGDRQWLKFFSQFQEADRLAAERLQGVMQDGIRDYTDHMRAPFTEAQRLPARKYTGRAGAGVPTLSYLDGRFQEALAPFVGITLLPVLPVEPMPYWGTELLFAFPAAIDTNLVFNDALPAPTASVVVQIQRVYIVINDASLRRVDGNIQLPTFGMSLSLDVDSWTWGFSASLPAETLANLEPASTGAPVEVEAMINGVPYRALVESISRSRSFGKSAISIQGRGKTALLDVPYSPVSNFTNSGARTAQQLMGDILSVNGVPMDWAVNWGLTDWLVPAGVFAHQGSYIGALGRIAESVGGYLQPHASMQSISVLPRYPSTPWSWGTVNPDFELPSSVTTTEGIAWAEKARYNRVFVSGVQQGVLGQVTRAGTAGDLLAPMITDALITHADAARQRGLSILSNTGRHANVTLKLPVLAETGIITPGKFVRYVDGATTRAGIVRSVGVEVAMPDIFQTLGIETHVN